MKNENILYNYLAKQLNASINAVKPVAGGAINEAYLLETSKGNFFLKTNHHPWALDMLKSEAKGLDILRKSNTIYIPEVLAVGEVNGQAYLLLEYIDKGLTINDFWTNFGQQLATLHQQSASQFGLDFDNFIGTLPQKNTRHDVWATFYIQERLMPQIKLAFNAKKLLEKDIKNIEKLYKKLPALCPEETPALTHGDLWSGNFLAHKNQQVVLFDPAVSYAHRELDLAMTLLFGGFDSRFYTAYQEVFPLEYGFEERVEVYQLYYLLVHVNLFGGSYVSSVRRILERFV